MPPFDPTKPYNELPPLPPKVELETRPVLKACIEARAALAELKQASQLLPNSAVLINTLPLLEARASSEIENIVTTADRLFRFAQPDREVFADPATKEALRYRTALRQGVELLKNRPLSTATAVAVCQSLLGIELDIRRIPGTTLMNDATGEVVYTPPAGEARLRELLANWERFLHEADELDPLIRMAVGHYQFEAIHPFSDGNGRTGRILNLLFLMEQGLLDSPILYLSRAIIRTRADYYRLLRAVTAEGRWEDWLLYMLEAVRETAQWTTDRIHRIRQLMQETAEHMRAEAPGIYSRELVELVFVQPYCRIKNVVEAGIAERQTAAVYLKKLCAADVLREVKVGREKLFINPRLMQLLTTEEPGALSFSKHAARTSTTKGKARIP
ncbi:protein adenylyltransferase Fic [Pelomicrobium methylotrophicum]|uniref:Fic family protein n=1 Tax=Pelomicrobium methylotrophicum TaxID=2602750 RepID=A0A5C7EQE7_9PROT|nr:Fic family protein [Pelomicrobium methylotrophicum]TXF13762.1 Fic family protein [Pelomicrobium methylotrophicum]